MLHTFNHSSCPSLRFYQFYCDLCKTGSPNLHTEFEMQMYTWKIRFSILFSIPFLTIPKIYLLFLTATKHSTGVSREMPTTDPCSLSWAVIAVLEFITMYMNAYVFCAGTHTQYIAAGNVSWQPCNAMKIKRPEKHNLSFQIKIATELHASTHPYVQSPKWWLSIKAHIGNSFLFLTAPNQEDRHLQIG